MAKKHNKNLVTDYSIFKFSIASSSNLFLTDLEGNYVDEDFKPLVEEVIEEQEIIEYENDLVASLPIKKTAKKKTVRKRKTTTTQTSDS